MISEWFHSVCGTCTAYMNNADFILGLSLGAAIVLISCWPSCIFDARANTATPLPSRASMDISR